MLTNVLYATMVTGTKRAALRSMASRFLTRDATILMTH